MALVRRAWARVRRVGRQDVLIGLLVLSLTANVVGIRTAKHASSAAKAAATELAIDEHSTCVTQQKGLAANVHLAVALSEISLILSGATPAKLAAVPEPQRRYFKGLEYHAKAYGETRPKSRPKPPKSKSSARKCS